MLNEIRRNELSDKFSQMGKSLLEEGSTLQDYTITQSGSLMILMSSLVLEDEQMFVFSELCSMFTAKQILESMKENSKNFLSDLLNGDIPKPKKTKKPKDDNPDKSEK